MDSRLFSEENMFFFSLFSRNRHVLLLDTSEFPHQLVTEP